jgi:hypothetical protein
MPIESLCLSYDTGEASEREAKFHLVPARRFHFSLSENLALRKTFKPCSISRRPESRAACGQRVTCDFGLWRPRRRLGLGRSQSTQSTNSTGNQPFMPCSMNESMDLLVIPLGRNSLIDRLTPDPWLLDLRPPEVVDWI